LPKELPDFQEKCLRIYDAIDYADNVFNVPVVAYSGEKDPQKAAADNIEKALQGFKEPFRFTHLIAPGLQHQMPKEWQEQAEAEYKKCLAMGRSFPPERVRFVTYTTRYNFFGHGLIVALEHQYEKAIIDSHWTKDGLKITTENIAVIRLESDSGPAEHPLPAIVVIDGQNVPARPSPGTTLLLEKKDGKWAATDNRALAKQLRKVGGAEEWLQGPIDDAFTRPFILVVPHGEGWFPAANRFAKTAHEQFAHVWDKYFRGQLKSYGSDEVEQELMNVNNLILFGDSGSNPLIAKVLPKLPITWTKESLLSMEWNTIRRLIFPC
jgi:hypothetical protein